MTDVPEGGCHYCTKPGPRRAGPEDGLSEDMFVCDACWRLLKNPATAMALIRGDLNLTLRGGDEPLRGRIEGFVESLRGLRRRN